MGCTEPIAVAYAAAVARQTLGELPDRVRVGASGSMIKNVKSVIVPNTDNMKGLEAAAAAGIVAGRPEQKLEVIADVTPEETKAIRAYLEQADVKVEHVENGVTFDIIVTVWKGAHTAQVRIAVFHTNIVRIEKDGEVMLDLPVHGDEEENLTDRSLLDMEHIWGLCPFGGHRGREADPRPADPVQHGHCRRRPPGRLRGQHRQRPAGHGGQ